MHVKLCACKTGAVNYYQFCSQTLLYHRYGFGSNDNAYSVMHIVF